jgi:hypothetical protein
MKRKKNFEEFRYSISNLNYATKLNVKSIQLMSQDNFFDYIESLLASSEYDECCLSMPIWLSENIRYMSDVNFIERLGLLVSKYDLEKLFNGIDEMENIGIWDNSKNYEENLRAAIEKYPSIWAKVLIPKAFEVEKKYSTHRLLKKFGVFDQDTNT